MASGSCDNNKETRWYFTSEQLRKSPSRAQGMDAEKELDHRQQAAHLIQDMGQRLRVNQLCINTAIVYMHRFYAFHSFTQFHQNGIAMAALFLAAKVEEQPRKLESVIQVAHLCLNVTATDSKEMYQEQASDLVFNESVLLQTLGFEVAVDHPHTHVVRTCQLVKAGKDLAQTSYFLASNSLHLTTMCLQYRPTVVACFCIHLACKWSRWEIPQSTEGKDWFLYVDKTVSMELLEQLTNEFLQIYDRSPARLKSKLGSTIKDLSNSARMGERGESSGRQHSSGEHNRSSSSHQRSSSSTTSNHHQLKQQLQSSSHPSGDYSQKPSSHSKIPGSSTNVHNSNRHRSDRGERPGLPNAERVNFPTAQRSSGNSSNSMSSISRSSSSGMAQARPSASNTHDSNNYPRTDSNKQRLMSHPHGSGQSSHQRTSSSQASSSNKLDQRHIQQREQKLPPDAIQKNLQKPSPSNSNAIYPSSNSNDSNRNTTSRHPSVTTGHSQSASYNKNLSRNSMQSDQTSVQQSQALPPQSTQLPKRPSQLDTSSSSFRLTEELTNIKSLDTMDLISLSPPKQLLSTQNVKAPSIFSPEWGETKPTIGGGSNGISDDLTMSPTKHDKLLINPDLNKLDNRTDHYGGGMMGGSGHSKAYGLIDKRPSNSSKRHTENLNIAQGPNMIYDTNRLDNKLVNKRSYQLEFGGNDSVDTKEYKMRKVEPLSPSSLVNSVYGLSNTNSSSGYDDLMSSSKSYNGIETNPDLVSSLLKESLFSENSNKFGVTPLSLPSNVTDEFEPLIEKNVVIQQVQQQQQLYQQPQSLQQQQPLQAQQQHQPPPPSQIQQQQSLQQLQSLPHPQHLHQNPQDQVHMHQMQQQQMQMQQPPVHMQRPTKSDYSNIDSSLSTFEPQMQSQSNAFLAHNSSTNLQKPITQPLQIPVDDTTDLVHKSEKKKKKEKHKNKDKEKSKDREERKKHKKDKDRHKEKDKERDNTDELVGHEPLKITIPKQKIGLKITISKEHYENYGNTEGQSGHSKKKDKHRERDKDKSTKTITNPPKLIPQSANQQYNNNEMITAHHPSYQQQQHQYKQLQIQQQQQLVQQQMQMQQHHQHQQQQHQLMQAQNQTYLNNSKPNISQYHSSGRN